MLTIDRALRGWVLENAARGCTLESMVDSMVAAGHARDHARAVMVQVLSQSDAQALAQARTRHAPVTVPKPLADRGTDGATTVQCSDRCITVIARLTAPPVIVFGDVLSNDECDELIALARTKLERSLVVDPVTGAASPHAERNSEGTFFTVNENPLVATIDRRLSELLRWPIENGEGLQILHYCPGDEYRPHFDYFDPNDSGSHTHLTRAGNRVATMIIYLRSAEAGGGTIFPDIGLEVTPVRGNAVFFSYDTPEPESLTLHAGAPVSRGEKWIATKWLRERQYESPDER